MRENPGWEEAVLRECGFRPEFQRVEQLGGWLVRGTSLTIAVRGAALNFFCRLSTNFTGTLSHTATGWLPRLAGSKRYVGGVSGSTSGIAGDWATVTISIGMRSDGGGGTRSDAQKSDRPISAVQRDHDDPTAEHH